jgi:hypothetical protein
MVGSVLTSSSSMTRGFVSARKALALRENPILPGIGEAFSGVSVVLTVAVTLFCLAVQSGLLSRRGLHIAGVHAQRAGVPSPP